MPAAFLEIAAKTRGTASALCEGMLRTLSLTLVLCSLALPAAAYPAYRGPVGPVCPPPGDASMTEQVVSNTVVPIDGVLLLEQTSLFSLPDSAQRPTVFINAPDGHPLSGEASWEGSVVVWRGVERFEPSTQYRARVVYPASYRSVCQQTGTYTQEVTFFTGRVTAQEMLTRPEIEYATIYEDVVEATRCCQTPCVGGECETFCANRLVLTSLDITADTVESPYFQYRVVSDVEGVVSDWARGVSYVPLAGGQPRQCVRVEARPWVGGNSVQSEERCVDVQLALPAEIERIDLDAICAEPDEWMGRVANVAEDESDGCRTAGARSSSTLVMIALAILFAMRRRREA